MNNAILTRTVSDIAEARLHADSVKAAALDVYEAVLTTLDAALTKCAARYRDSIKIYKSANGIEGNLSLMDLNDLEENYPLLIALGSAAAEGIDFKPKDSAAKINRCRRVMTGEVKRLNSLLEVVQ